MHKSINQEESVGPSAWPMELIHRQNEMFESLVCCCNLFDPTLEPREHLDDCVPLFDETDDDSVPSQAPSSRGKNTSVRSGHPRSTAQKHSHRESMARLRLRLRDSMLALQEREKALEQALRDAVASRPAARQQDNASTPNGQLRDAYVGLVREQIELLDERRQLDATRALREKYERLVTREMDKTRTFRAHTEQS